LFFDKAKRKVRHPRESGASQLGWHPTNTPSSTAFSIRTFKIPKRQLNKNEKFTLKGHLKRNGESIF